MHRFLFLCAVSNCLIAWPQSLVVTGGTQTGTLTLPNSAPFNSMGSFRIEMRIYNMNPPSNAIYASIFELVDTTGHGYGILFTQSGGVSLCGQDGQAGFICPSPQQFSTFSDVVARYQRDAVNGHAIFDVLDYQTGKVLYTRTVSIAGGNIVLKTNGAFINNSSVVADIAWIKWYSTVVPAGAPYSMEATLADLGDWQFEGGFTNQATGGYNVSLSLSSPSYTQTPVYSPGCSAGTPTSFRVGFPAQLDGSASTRGDESPLTYFWQQVGSSLPDIRPQRLRWSSHTVATPTLTGFTFGPLNFQLTVTAQGSGLSSTCAVHDGAVATDDNGTVVTITQNAPLDDAIATLIGPQVQFNKNPWLYYDQSAAWDAAVQMADLDVVNADWYPYWNVPATGTVSVATNSNVITGYGTSFTTDFCQGPTNPSTPNGKQMILWYQTGRAFNGVPETGRAPRWIGACQSDTQMTMITSGCCGMTSWAASFPDQAGNPLTYAIRPPTTGTTTWDQNMAPPNFYDNVQAYYELYYRSGIDTYLAAARKLADRFWTSPEVDRGMGYVPYFGAPFSGPGRPNSVSGLILRALDIGDGHPDMWAGLHKIWQNNSYYNLVLAWPQYQAASEAMDGREAGYELAQAAYCALYDQDQASDAPGGLSWPAYCRSMIATSFGNGNTGLFPRAIDPIENGWLTWFSARSSYDTGQTWSGSTVTLTNGSTTVSCTGTNCGFLPTDFYQYSQGSTTPCTSGTNCYSYPVLFGTAIRPHDLTGEDSQVYCYPNPCTFIDSNHFTLDQPYNGTTGTHGWVMALDANGHLDGSNTHMVGYAGLGYMEGILGWAFGLAGRAMKCASPGVPAHCDDTIAATADSYAVMAANWIMNYGYLSADAGMSYFGGSPTCTSPASSTNFLCTQGESVMAKREIMGDGYRGLLTGYLLTTDAGAKAAMQTALDNWYAGMWAKPGVGTPPVSSPDGTYDNSFDATGCTIHATYPTYTNCGSNGYYLTNGAPYGEKFFGQHFGISNQATWPAYRIGGPVPSSVVTIYVSGRIRDVDGAAKMQVRVTEPTGVMGDPVICSSSPCAVSVNQTIGNPIIQVTYLTAEGKAVSSGEPFVVNVK